MAELGLFSAANPVTSGTPAEAFDAVTTGRSAPGGLCGELSYFKADLPDRLQGHGFVRSNDCPTLTQRHYATGRQQGICEHVFQYNHPWVDCEKGLVLMQNPQGEILLWEHPCVAGAGKSEYKAYDLNGNYVCSTYPTDAAPQDPFTDERLRFANISSGVQMGMGTALGRPRGGSGLPVTVAGVRLTDVEALLSGTGASPDLSGVLRVLASLVLQAGSIGGSVDGLAPALQDFIVPGFGGVASSLDRLAPGLGAQIQQAVAAQGDDNKERLARAAALAAGLPPDVAVAVFRGLAREVPGILAKIGDLYKHAIETLITKVLDLFRDDIEAHAPVHPGNVDRVAAGALRSALTAGSVAQLAGMGLELIHPLKTLGIQQAIGVLAQFAGFSEIARPYFGATLRYGIGLPAEHRAAAHFRTVLPGVGLVRDLAARGVVGLDKYRDRLVLEGYPDPYPAAFAATAYEALSPRALAAFTDGSEADRPWLARKLRYAGVSPEDTARIVRALELKATQPGRSRLVSGLLTQYQQGRLERAELEAGLHGAGLSPTHLAYYLRAADVERRGARMEAVGREVVNQYLADTVSRDYAAQLLGGLGFTDDEVSVRLVVAELKKGVKQVQDETRDIETEVRALKAQGLRAAIVQYRAGFLGRGPFVTIGQSMGYSAAYMALAADLADLQGPPSSTADAPAIGTGALQEARARVAELIAQEVQAKRLDTVQAVVSLRALALPPNLAATLVDLALALAGPDAIAGDYGLPGGLKLGGAFRDVAATVLEGLHGLEAPADVLAAFVKTLGIPGQDRDALQRLLGDVRSLIGLRAG